jgi:hypothetical protein
MHLEQRRLVIGHIRMHRANDAAVIDDARDVWERLADVDPALAVFRKREWRRNESAAFGLLEQLTGRLLSLILSQRRLGIECIHMRRTAIHEEEDDALRTRCEMRRTCGRRTGGQKRIRAE